MRNQILGIDPSEVHTTPVHATGTRAVDLNDPTKVYVYFRVASSVAQDTLCELVSNASTGEFTAQAAGANDSVACVRDQAAVDGSVTAKYAWFLYSGLWTGATGLTGGAAYTHLLTAGAALQTSTTIAWGIARSTTSLEIIGWGSPGVAPHLDGVNPLIVDTEPRVAPGTRATFRGAASRGATPDFGPAQQEFIYLRIPSGTAISNGDLVSWNGSYDVVTTTNAAKAILEQAEQGITSSAAVDQYAWALVRGSSAANSNSAQSAIDGVDTQQGDGYILDTANGWALFY